MGYLAERAGERSKRGTLRCARRTAEGGWLRSCVDGHASSGGNVSGCAAECDRELLRNDGNKLVKLCQDVMSGGKDVRPGLADALRTLQGSADVLIVLKFDRLSRSIKHFCELYERYFKDGTKELVAIRESIRMDSSLGRALVGILLVFAQMEREAIGERTREAIGHIKRSGYHFGKVPFGKRTIPAPDHPRMKILVDNEDEQKVIEQILKWSESGSESVRSRKLNEQGVVPPQGKEWTKSLIYNLRLRMGQISPRPINTRSYSDREVRADSGPAGARPYRAADCVDSERTGVDSAQREAVHREGFTGSYGRFQATKVLSPRGYLEMMLTKMERAHDAEHPTVPFARPTLEEMGRLLEGSGLRHAEGT